MSAAPEQLQLPLPEHVRTAGEALLELAARDPVAYNLVMVRMLLRARKWIEQACAR